ncbi:MAG: Rieske 2Fe-2S domain-containing protein [Acidimicrobiales bacterium]
MRITTIGHAGLLVEAGGARILCDPWFNPAYLASWFPFPRNDGLDLDVLARPDYLYVSHLHRDHFDPAFLSEHVDPSTTILLPDYPLDLMEREMRRLGFRSFLRTKDGVPEVLGDLTLTVVALGAPTDGPIGDSALLVEDGSGRILNLNDARPTDLGPFLAGGPIDVLFLQTSGAIWYPMVYDFPPEKMAALGARKREAGLERAERLVDLLDPAVTVSFAGPPCFLDDELFHLNDLDRDPTNTFPDQTVFLEHLAQRRGPGSGRLMVPGSVGELGVAGFEVSHPCGDEEVAAIFSGKERYLRAYQRDRHAVISAERAAWGHDGIDLVDGMSAWIEPLLAGAERLCSEIGGSVVVDFGDVPLVVDFRNRRVGRWSGEAWDHRFSFEREVGEHLLHDRVEDWVNDAFLSCRFRASRRVPHNDSVFSFFKCLSEERMGYLERWIAEQEANEETIALGGWRVQRRCPHAKADLSRFGVVAGDTLTCHLHGYRYDLASGQCLTNPRLRIEAEPIVPGAGGIPAPANPPPGGAGPAGAD